MMGTNTTVITGSTPKTAYLATAKAVWNNNQWQFAQCENYRYQGGFAGNLGSVYPGWYDCGVGVNITTLNPTPPNWFTNQRFFYSPIVDIDFSKLDFNYIGQFDALHNPKVGTVELDKNKNPGLSQIIEPRSEIVLGKKITYLDQIASQSVFTGFNVAVTDAKTPDLKNYQSPIDPNGCDGYGIYFLTDGEPNNGHDRTWMMGRSLKYGSEDGNTLLQMLSQNGGVDSLSETGVAYAGTSGWGAIGRYARILRDPTKNPARQEIKIAAVGFGETFTNGSPGTKVVNLPNAKGELVPTNVIRCEGYTAQDAKNLCMLGEKSYGYGEGGFLATSEAGAVAQSIIDFVKSNEKEIPSAPAGTISIPRDPLSANNLQPYAYLPMVQPEMVKAVTTWEGNLKKYHTVNGTLYGKGASAGAIGARLYSLHARPTEGNASFPFALNPDAEDLWQAEPKKADNTPVSVGGTRSQLVHPSASDKTKVRSVFVETTVNGARKLQKVSTNGTNLIDFDKLGTEYTVLDKAYILNFLGYKVPVTADSYPNATTATEANRQLTEKLKAASFQARPVMGGVMHSPPVLASYSGQLDTATGNITSNEALRSDFLLYGSMDGALHMVSARTGAESFSFIPRQMFDDTSQRHALLLDSTHGETGQPKFGVDAPWQTHAEYTFGTNQGVTSMRATKMFAYGGLRMGGVGLYGLNITNSAAPTLAFSINKDTAGFSRLGQTWTKPVTAIIKTGTGPRSATNTKRVLFVSGGYDMCYENPAFKLGAANTDTNCANKDKADGNAVYMIDAENGTLLQTWTASDASGGLSASTDGRQHMKHSIVAEVTPLDRNSNGFVDSIYFADLGGQVFRIDLQEEVGANSNALTRRVVRVFDSNAGMGDAHLPYRFYDKPIVSFYNQPNGRIALVNVSTGDRSSPLHKRRALEDANRIYGIIDRDLATPVISSGRGLTGLISKDLTNAMLNHYNPADLEGNATEAKRLIEELSSGRKQGWYYDMNRYADRIGVKNLKSVGPGAVIGGIYYASVYSPEYNYNNRRTCDAAIVGGTERQGYCLPWGICANPKSGALTTKNGTVGYNKVGPGIQELAVATLTSEAGSSTNRRTLIGTQTFDERITAQTQGYTGGGTDPFANAENAGQKNAAGTNPVEKPVSVATNKVLKVKRWYDLQTAEDDQ